MIYGREEVMNHLLSRVCVCVCVSLRCMKPLEVLKNLAQTVPSMQQPKSFLFQHETDLHNINIHCQLNKKGYKTNIENARQDLIT